jgi:hypothetical protein
VIADPEVLSALGEGRQVYVALRTDAGPHVTPELYAWSGDRLWFAAAAPTFKARTIEPGERVGALVRTAGGDVLVAGPAERFDLADPVALGRRFGRLPSAVRALAGYTVRNAPDLLAFGRDVVAGRLGRRLPPRRVLFAVEAEQVTLIDAQPTGGTPAVVGLPGPIALPARWFGDDARLRLAPELLERYVVGDEVPVGIVVDHYVAPGPAAKVGTLLRGTARRVGGSDLLEVDLERRVEWDGTATASAPVRGERAARGA